jgi:hypothetical protein
MFCSWEADQSSIVPGAAPSTGNWPSIVSFTSLKRRRDTHELDIDLNRRPRERSRIRDRRGRRRTCVVTGRDWLRRARLTCRPCREGPDSRGRRASMMKGASLRAVAELLGHRGLRMVMRYAHLSPAYLSSEVGLLDDPPPTQTDKRAKKGNVSRGRHGVGRRSLGKMARRTGRFPQLVHP